MKMHESDAPLLFWKAVQVLKKTGKQDQREEKAKEILHKYFGRAAGAGAINLLSFFIDILVHVIAATAC